MQKCTAPRIVGAGDWAQNLPDFHRLTHKTWVGPRRAGPVMADFSILLAPQSVQTC